MRTRINLDRLINAQSVAIVGVTEDRERIGGQAFRALTEFGFKGKVYPVNPKHTAIKGHICYSDILAVPRPCDVALVVVPAQQVPAVIEDCGRAGIGFAIVLSSGFRETSEAGAMLERQVVAAAKRGGVHVIGPNCQGVLGLPGRLFCGFGGPFQRPDQPGGPMAMVTQSGGWGFAVLTQVQAAGLGFNYVVSTGNEADVDTLDVLEFFLKRDDVEIVTTYMEGVRDGRRLLALGERALELKKPILVWKVGNSSSGSRAAQSHTANLTSMPELYRAVFRQGGFIEVRDVDDLVDVARAFLGRRLPRGGNVAAVTSSGGAGVLMADRCEERGLQLPQLGGDLRESLRQLVPTFGSSGNPIDITAALASDPVKSNRVISLLLDDAGIDQVILWKGNATGEKGLQWVQKFLETTRPSDKPVLVSIAPDRADEVLRILDENRVPRYPTPSRAVTGAAALWEFFIKCRRHAAREMRAFPRQKIAWPGSHALGEHHAKQVLATYGIEGTREVLLSVDAVAALTDAPLPYPLAIKVESPDIPHKTEAGAVRLGISTLSELKGAARAVVASARTYNPEARIDGVLVQEMAAGVEVMLGVVHDPSFGAVVVVGLGGIFTEVLHDLSYRCVPVDLSTAHVMIEELRGVAVLKGARGRPVADVEALAEAISRLSLLAADHVDRIAEIDVNPLFVRPAGQGAVAADALIVLRDRQSPGSSAISTDQRKGVLSDDGI